MNRDSTWHIHHCASQPAVFVGRQRELALLDRSLTMDGPSVVAFVGPGGQGKTAILQHWLGQLSHRDEPPLAGVFFWSFYRGKESDGCLRALYSAVAGREAGDVSASWCVDRLLPQLRAERWAILLDGAEVAQHESGPWFGRLLHPDLGRLLEELATEPTPGVAVLTTRFPLPDLVRRRWMRTESLATLDPASARQLLTNLGVQGTDAELEAVATRAGHHAKAVELLATWLVDFGSPGSHASTLPTTRESMGDPPSSSEGNLSDEERHVLQVLELFQTSLPRDTQDILALTTAFRDPQPEPRLREYLVSPPVRSLLHDVWGRGYVPFAERPAGWLAEQLDRLVRLRLLERVGRAPLGQQVDESSIVLDAHPLVRRGFEHVLGSEGRRQSAGVRAGFLRGRPDRARAASLDAAREEIELFHAYCDAEVWDEADRVFAGLEQPRYRFLAPAFERDLLLRFFPERDRRRPPLWPGFRRRRSLAVCLEMLGQFEDALDTYPAEDAPLRGDALLALGRLAPLLTESRAPHPWEMLWQSYRAHALCLAGRTDEALALCRRIVPRDVYEWTHVFECLLRLRALDALDMRGLLDRPGRGDESRWEELARRRMRADRDRLASPGADLGAELSELIEAYDRGGMPWERALVRLSLARWLAGQREDQKAADLNQETLTLAERFGLRIVAADVHQLQAALGRSSEEPCHRLRQVLGYHGPTRP